MNPTTEAVPVRARNPRTVFLRDAAVFHVKLMLDGFRDLILFPVSLIAVLLDAVSRDGPPGRHFYEVLHFARETERWNNLFEAADRAPVTHQPRPGIPAPGLDEFIVGIETRLADGYANGELSAKAKAAFEQFRAAVSKAQERSAGSAR